MSSQHMGNRWSTTRFVALTEIEMRALFSEGKSLLSSLLLEPMVQMLLLAAGLQGLIGDGDNFYQEHSYIAFVLPGLLMLQALRGFSRTMYRTVLDRQWGMLTIKRMAGAGGAGYAGSKIAAPMLALVIQITVMYALGFAMGARYDALNMLLAGMLCLVAVSFWASVAIIVTGFVKDYVTRDMIVTWLMLPLGLAAPVFYTLESAPTYIQWIARFNPLAYQVEAARTMLLDGTFTRAAAAMIALTLIATVAAVVSVSHGDAMTSEGGR